MTIDGQALTPEEWIVKFQAHLKDAKVKGIKWEEKKVYGFTWKTANQNTVVKHYAPYAVSGEILPDQTGILIDEPIELTGENFVVLYNADGSERFRLSSTIDLAMFPEIERYMKSTVESWTIPELRNPKLKLTGSQFFGCPPRGIGAAVIFRIAEASGRGAWALEFDLETGKYTGRYASPTLHDPWY